VVNVSAMIVLGSAGAVLADPRKKRATGWYAPRRDPREIGSGANAQASRRGFTVRRVQQSMHPTTRKYPLDGKLKGRLIPAIQ